MIHWSSAASIAASVLPQSVRIMYLEDADLSAFTQWHWLSSINRTKYMMEGAGDLILNIQPHALNTV